MKEVTYSGKVTKQAAELFRLSRNGKQRLDEWENGEDLDLKRPVPACILTVSRVAGDIDTDASSGDSDPETADVRSPIQMPVGGAPKRRPVRSRV